MNKQQDLKSSTSPMGLKKSVNTEWESSSDSNTSKPSILFNAKEERKSKKYKKQEANHLTKLYPECGDQTNIKGKWIML
jgi:hypothetical protein